MAALIGASVTKPSGKQTYTATIPLDDLSEDGVPPEQGDSVSAQVDGTVTSVDAENATIKITAINGQPVDESAAEETAEDSGTSGESTADMGSRLRAGAAKGPPMF